MMRPLLNALLFFPSRDVVRTPAAAGLIHRDVELRTDDGQRLHGWWIERRAAALGHVLLCHGNAGNVGDRILHAEVLTAVGFGHRRDRPAQASPCAAMGRRHRRSLAPPRPARRTRSPVGRPR